MLSRSNMAHFNINAYSIKFSGPRVATGEFYKLFLLSATVEGSAAYSARICEGPPFARQRFLRYFLGVLLVLGIFDIKIPKLKKRVLKVLGMQSFTDKILLKRIRVIGIL